MKAIDYEGKQTAKTICSPKRQFHKVAKSWLMCFLYCKTCPCAPQILKGNGVPAHDQFHIPTTQEANESPSVSFLLCVNHPPNLPQLTSLRLFDIPLSKQRSNQWGWTMGPTSHSDSELKVQSSSDLVPAHKGCKLKTVRFFVEWRWV